MLLPSNFLVKLYYVVLYMSSIVFVPSIWKYAQQIRLFSIIKFFTNNSWKGVGYIKILQVWIVVPFIKLLWKESWEFHFNLFSASIHGSSKSGIILYRKRWFLPHAVWKIVAWCVKIILIVVVSIVNLILSCYEIPNW